MSFEDGERLVESLSRTHSATRRMLAGVDLDIRVYPESGWRIRDVIGHIATWDRQVAKSLRAYRNGKEYALPDHEEAAFNEQDVANQQKLAARQVFDEWEAAREDFKSAVTEIPLDQYPGDVLYPWGDERGTIALLVKYMTDHDIEHHDEIAKALHSAVRSEK